MTCKNSFILLFVLLCAFSVDLKAQNFSKAPDPRQPAVVEDILSGKWQEFKRTTFSKKNPVHLSIEDSLKIQLFNDSTMYIRLKNGGYTSVIYSFSKGLHFGEDYHFPFYEINKELMVLGDGKVKRYLKPVDQFYIPRFEKRVPGKEKGKVNAKAEALKGIWQTYKKMDPKFDHSALYLKRLEIMEAHDDGTFLVEISRSSLNDFEKDKATMAIEDDVMVIKTVKGQSYTYEIHKSAEGEMILHRGTTTIFLRDFSK